MKYASYSLVQIVIAIATAALVLGCTLWLVPMRNNSIGDLARIDWRSINYWGPSIPVVAVKRPLFTVGEYDQYYDVYILGDSFSIDVSKSWPNYIAAEGFSVRVKFLGKDTGTAINQLLESQTFRTSPPKLLIYEAVERGLSWRLKDADGTCLSNRSPAPNVILRRGPPSDPETYEVPKPAAGDFSEEQLTYARDFLIEQMRRPFKRSHEVYELPLTAPRFSNVRADRILFLAEDSYKVKWTESEVEHMRCALGGFRHRVQANGKTLFVAMIVPDKLSIYHDDVLDTSMPSTVIPRLVDTGLLVPRLDIDLRAAVTAGRLDVYLPSDTHWGAAGIRIAVESLLTLLRTNRFLVN